MPARPPSLRAVSAFEAAARLQSFSMAAAELNLTHGAVSHAVRALEERLGQRLFERRGRGVALTEAGRILAARVRLGIGLLSEAFETRPWLQRSKLVISTLPSFASRFLVPRLHRFRVRHPEIALDMRASEGLAPVGENGIDIGLRYGPGCWPGLTAVKLATERLFPVVSPSYDREALVSPRDLSGHELIGHIYTPWQPWFAAAGLDWPEPTCTLVFDRATLALEAAASGAGIALARSLLVEPDLRAGRLVRLFEADLASDYCYWLVWSPVSPKQEAIAAFSNWLIAELGSEGAFENGEKSS